MTGIVGIDVGWTSSDAGFPGGGGDPLEGHLAGRRRSGIRITAETACHVVIGAAVAPTDRHARHRLDARTSVEHRRLAA